MRAKVNRISIGKFAAAALIISLTAVVLLGQETHEKKHGFAVRQYESFHDVLHPLEHEALPNKDFRRIRSKSALLVKRGQAIVRLGVPQGVSDENKAEFSKELRKFNQSLTKFRTDARRGSNARLQVSYSAVHDSFEMLAAMLPRG